MTEITMEATDKLIFEFTVLWEAWECDSTAGVCEKLDGSRYFIMTNHKNRYVATRKELEDRIEEYKKVIEDTEKAMLLVLQGT